ncbi:MAG: BON domain-containing protein [Pseudomonadota bacterium]|nr:BON domain-containing protein [Pseudomonadota bacterium]
MKTTTILAGLLALGSAAPITSYADQTDTDRSHPGTFIKDSAITAKIKTKLAADHITSAAKIHVDTDADGVVWLTGTAHTKAEVDRAGQIARDTEHVVSVKNKVTVKKDD